MVSVENFQKFGCGNGSCSGFAAEALRTSATSECSFRVVTSQRGSDQDPLSVSSCAGGNRCSSSRSLTETRLLPGQPGPERLLRSGWQVNDTVGVRVAHHPAERIGQNQATFGIGIGNFNGFPAIGIQDVAGLDRAGIHQIIGQRDDGC